MTDSIARQPRGIPAGGQFVPTSHTEPQVALGRPFGAFAMDPDGTEWDRADSEDWPWAEPGTEMIESGQVNGVGILIEAGADGSAEDRVRYHVVDYRGMGAETVNRQPKGFPTGGRFAPDVHAEPAVALAQPASDLLDPDGTRWDHDGDEYSDWWTSSRDGFGMKVTADIRDESVRWSLRWDGPGDRGSLPQGEAASLDDAKAEAKAAGARMARYGRSRMHIGGMGLRGPIISVSEISPGIDSVHTRHHGFYVLTDERNLEVDPAWRQPSSWYEGDCAWTAPVITHHRDLDWKLVRRAHEEARRYFPEEYDAVVGKDPARYGVTDYTPAVRQEEADPA